MKHILKNKLSISVLLLAFFTPSVIFAKEHDHAYKHSQKMKDFSHYSNEELLDFLGKIEPKDFPAFKMEMRKRTSAMDNETYQKFHDQMREKATKNTQNLSDADYKKRQLEIKSMIKKTASKMSPRELEESKLLSMRCDCDDEEHTHREPYYLEYSN
ncbi:DUF1104 domain-containing protein [Helicobacter cetorum]|uniref:DUF1104 domain-containing protein n=1 Tax=Helicobacter cetorum TaxID=138563 RepID=UPI000CF0E4BF|nr:DUF1104 domain-containing protein [Helicobacter cetorum]